MTRGCCLVAASAYLFISTGCKFKSFYELRDEKSKHSFSLLSVVDELRL